VRGAALDAQGQAAPLSEARAPAFRPASRLRGPGTGDTNESVPVVTVLADLDPLELKLVNVTEQTL